MPSPARLIFDCDGGGVPVDSAGMTVYGCAAMTDPARLEAAGADRVFRHMAELPALLS